MFHKSILPFVLLAIAALLAPACNKPVSTYDSAMPDPTYVEAGGLPPGVMMLKTYGVAARMEEAKRDAVKNAVKAVIFKGIPGSSVEKPLIRDQSKCKDFFDKFFSDNGGFSTYVSESTVQPEGTHKIKGGRQQACLHVKVNYKTLITHLEDNKCVPKMGI